MRSHDRQLLKPPVGKLSTTTTPRPVTTSPTWSAYEVTPGGRETLLAERLTYTQVLAARFPEASWAVVWRQDPARDA